MHDLISRQAAIDAINKAFERVFAWDGTSPLGDKVLENVPSAQASKETREAWKAVIEAIRPYEPELAGVCVRECVYRGFCPEMVSCGYCESEAYRLECERYGL